MILLLLMVAGEAFSQNYRGLSLSTDYPSITTTSGKLLTLQLKVHNYGLPPQRLSLSADFPSIEGTPSTQFTYKLTIKNSSAESTLVNLKAQAPPGFNVQFAEEFGSTELTSVPIQAGESKNVSVKVSPPDKVPAGAYKIAVDAFTEAARAQQSLSLVVKGTPTLSIFGPDGRVSLDATAGHEQSVQLTVKNTGSADAKNIHLSIIRSLKLEGSVQARYCC